MSASQLGSSAAPAPATCRGRLASLGAPATNDTGPTRCTTTHRPPCMHSATANTTPHLDVCRCRLQSSTHATTKQADHTHHHISPLPCLAEDPSRVSFITSIFEPRRSKSPVDQSIKIDSHRLHPAQLGYVCQHRHSSPGCPSGAGRSPAPAPPAPAGPSAPAAAQHAPWRAAAAAAAF